MPRRFLDLVVTPAVAREQQRTYGAAHAPSGDSSPEPLGPDEAEFIQARDSFYLASASSSGWPYVQHRGGPAGFLHVLDPRTLAFADVRGNRQLITAGNVSGDPRVALLLMDYPARQRLKILGRATFSDAKAEPALAAALTPTGGRVRVERIVRIAVEAWDWNCPQHITPRYTEAEVEERIAPLRTRIAELEQRLAEALGS